MNLPKTFLLFRQVSGLVSIKQPEQANSKLNVGVFSENTGSMDQLDFLKSAAHETLKTVKYNDIDQGNIDVGKGTRDIPNTADYWLGDMYGGI